MFGRRPAGRSGRGSWLPAAGILDAPEVLLYAYKSDLLEDRFGLGAGDEEYGDLLAELGECNLGEEVSIAVDPKVNAELAAQLGRVGRKFPQDAEVDGAQGTT